MNLAEHKTSGYDQNFKTLRMLSILEAYTLDHQRVKKLELSLIQVLIGLPSSHASVKLTVTKRKLKLKNLETQVKKMNHMTKMIPKLNLS